MKYTIEYAYLEGFNYPYEVTAFNEKNKVVVCMTSDKSFSHAKEKAVSEIKAIVPRGEVTVPPPETINIIHNETSWEKEYEMQTGVLSVIKEANEATK